MTVKYITARNEKQAASRLKRGAVAYLHGTKTAADNAAKDEQAYTLDRSRKPVRVFKIDGSLIAA